MAVSSQAPLPSLTRRAPLSSRTRFNRLHRSLQKRSIRCMTELTVRGAREMLAAWAAERGAVAARRDEVVRAAVDAGLSKSEVHRLTGIARTTIDRIVGTSPEEGARQ
jgi:hypothetical protein